MSTPKELKLIRQILKNVDKSQKTIVKRNPRKTKGTRNPDFQKLQSQIKNTDTKNNTALKDSIKYNDFEKTSKASTKSAQLEQYIRAILLLKQGYSEVESFTSRYDPNLELVDKTLSDTADYKKQMDKRFTELLNLRPKIDNLTDKEEREFQAISREIERYSVDLNKMKTDIEKLKGTKELNSTEQFAARKIFAAKKSKAKLEEDTKTLYQYGT